MSKSLTSSFRIGEDLNSRVSDAARRMNRGKNWVIIRAIEDYVNKVERKGLAAEARRQSLLASQADRASAREAEFWDKAGDSSGWR